MINSARICLLAMALSFTLQGLSFSSTRVKGKRNRPTGLSVDFLTHSDQVYLNGYLTDTLLDEPLSAKENFRFTEIARRHPFFGWIVNSDQKNSLQTAFRILVASTPGNIRNNIGDFWDSGKIPSDQSINITYDGKALIPGKIYYWKVKSWINQGPGSDFSEVARFKTAPKLSDYATVCYPLQKEDGYPVSVKQLPGNVTFIDFGKDAFGRLKLILPGKTGADSITIRLGEAQKDGRIDRDPGGTIRYSEYKLRLEEGRKTYIVTIKPNKRNTGPKAIKLPGYTGDVTPFRYCETEGYRDQLPKSQIVREMTHYPFDETDSYFLSSDTLLNRIWELCRYTMKATSFAGIYVDGDRERIPYEADAFINQLGQYSVIREYSMARYSEEYLMDHGTWPTEWILQSVLMAWNDYFYTGNKEFLIRYYDRLKARTLTSLEDESGFISTCPDKQTPELLASVHLDDKLRDIVDWPQSVGSWPGKKEPGETDGFVFREINTVVNAFHYRALVLMAKIAGLLGKENDYRTYTGLAEKLKKAFNDQLLDKKRKVYVDGIGTGHTSLHANMFPLVFGLVPENYVEAISKFIQSRGMACSVYGSQFLLEALYESNNPAYGLQLLTSTTDRSWYNMLRGGSTITMEAWDNKYKPNQDWNHAWGAAPANIIPRKLMGIEPLQPGFGRIQIKPQPASLKYAEVRFPTIRGPILVSFNNEPGKSFLLQTTIPANTTALVYLPYWSESQKVKMDGKAVLYYRAGNHIIIDKVGSGIHKFETINH